MAKIKTKRAAKKRYRVRAGGKKFTRGKAFKRHNTGKRDQKNKRQLRRTDSVSSVDLVLVRQTLPYRFKSK